LSVASPADQLPAVLLLGSAAWRIAVAYCEQRAVAMRFCWLLERQLEPADSGVPLNFAPLSNSNHRCRAARVGASTAPITVASTDCGGPDP
jgi:hypothetical protein